MIYPQKSASIIKKYKKLYDLA
jgi:hypothetical protein